MLNSSSQFHVCKNMYLSVNIHCQARHAACCLGMSLSFSKGVKELVESSRMLSWQQHAFHWSVTGTLTIYTKCLHKASI